MWSRGYKKRLQRVDFVVRMLHHIAIPLGDRVNGRNKEDIRLSYAKIFGIFEYKWQCAIEPKRKRS